MTKEAVKKGHTQIRLNLDRQSLAILEAFAGEQGFTTASAHHAHLLRRIAHLYEKHPHKLIEIGLLSRLVTASEAA